MLVSLSDSVLESSEKLIMVNDRIIDVMDALAKDETFHPIERQDTSYRLCDKLW